MELREFLRRRRVALSNALLNLLVLVLDSVLQGLLFDFFLGELRQLTGGTDVADVLNVTLREHNVDLLKRTASSLWVEEPHHRDEDTVPRGEEQISTPLNASNHDGRDHDNSEVEEPVAAGRDGVGLRTGLDGRQLSGVEPRQRQPGGTEDTHVHEEAKDSTLSSLSIARNQAAKDNNHGSTLAKAPTKEQLATTNLLNKEPGECGENGVANHVDTANQKSEIV